MAAGRVALKESMHQGPCPARVVTTLHPERWTLLVLLIFPLLAWVGQVKAEEVTLELALIIGNNRHHLDRSRDLRYADDDALEAARTFQALHPRGQVFLLTTLDEETAAQAGGEDLVPQPPTIDMWLQTLLAMQMMVAAHRAEGPAYVTLLVHFSGHGERDASLHFEDGLLPAKAFRRGLTMVDADEIFALMDGCYLGSIPRGESVTPAELRESLFRDIELHPEDVPAGLGLIGATSIVLEQDYLSRGLLTLVALSGLSGPADLDGDLRITFYELGRYVSSQLAVMGGGPEVVVVGARQERITPVVDLEASGLGGVRLQRSFPAGHIRILLEESALVVAEFYYDSSRPCDVRLPRGAYRLIRLMRRTDWEQPGFPAVQYRLQVDWDLLSLDGKTESQQVVLLAKGMRGGGDWPPDFELIPITELQAYALMNSPFRLEGKRISHLPPPMWNVGVRLDAPGMGPDLARTDLEATKSSRAGGGVQLARLWPVHAYGPWSLSVGPQVQVGLTRQWDVYGLDPTLEGAVYQELRIGVTGGPSRYGSSMSTSLETEFSLAPALVMAGGELLEDPEAPAGVHRYRFPRNLAYELNLAFRIPLGPSLEWGPFLRAELLRVVLPTSAYGGGNAGLEGQIALGFQLRQDLHRSRRGPEK